MVFDLLQGQSCQLQKRIENALRLLHCYASIYTSDSLVFLAVEFIWFYTRMITNLTMSAVETILRFHYCATNLHWQHEQLREQLRKPKEAYSYLSQLNSFANKNAVFDQLLICLKEEWME